MPSKIVEQVLRKGEKHLQKKYIAPNRKKIKRDAKKVSKSIRMFVKNPSLKRLGDLPVKQIARHAKNEYVKPNLRQGRRDVRGARKEIKKGIQSLPAFGGPVIKVVK